MIPSDNPTISPSSLPSSGPSEHPTFSPTELPSLTPPVSTLVIVTYTRPSNSSQSDESQIGSVLMDDDEEMMSIFDEKYGEESCTFDECRRLNQITQNQAHGPFIIQSLNSSVLSVATCENAEELCYEISTNVSILHYPVIYSIERTELIVLSTVLNFLEDRSVIPISEQPETVTTSISIIFSGVQPEVMDVEEQVDFIEVVFDYLEDILGKFDPPILVEGTTLFYTVHFLVHF